MKKLLVSFLICMCIFNSTRAQRFSVFSGFSYVQQFPDGSYISNSALPNAEGKITFSFLNTNYFKMNVGMGVATHNFLLKDISENKTYGYFRSEPFASLSAMGCLPDESNFPVQGVYIGIRAGFFNQWNFNPSWQVGLLSKPFGKVRFYAQFSKLLYYSIPDNNYLLFDFDNNYYPLGNERWSITAGVVYKIMQKEKE